MPKVTALTAVFPMNHRYISYIIQTKKEADFQNVRFFFSNPAVKLCKLFHFVLKNRSGKDEKEVDYEIPRTQQKTSCDQAFHRPAGRSQDVRTAVEVRPWLQVRTIANHGNSWSFARKMWNWQK